MDKNHCATWITGLKRSSVYLCYLWGKKRLKELLFNSLQLFLITYKWYQKCTLQPRDKATALVDVVKKSPAEPSEQEMKRALKQ